MIPEVKLALGNTETSALSGEPKTMSFIVVSLAGLRVSDWARELAELTIPSADEMRAPRAEFSLTTPYTGTATAARVPITAKTTTSSSREKPNREEPLVDLGMLFIVGYRDR